MKPSSIKDVLDLARKARKEGRLFNPLFVGAPGIAKSAIIQQWCNENKLPFIDLRLAYLEAPDMIGYPSIKVKDGRQFTTHNLPEFWPTEGEGVLFLDEINRGNTSVMNTCMQLLTDRKIHGYNLPEGWIIASAINPENEFNDVNTMDSALKNRFAIYNVEYDKNTFVQYMKDKNYDTSVVQWVENNVWTYTPPEKLAQNAKYISPRTIEQLDTVVKMGFPQDMEFTHYESILGVAQGKSFFAFKNDQRPVLYKDLVDNRKKALKQLKTYADPNNYKNAQISITIKELIENLADPKADKDNELLAEVCLVLPADQGPVLIRELEYVRKNTNLLQELCSKYPKVKEYYKDILTK